MLGGYCMSTTLTNGLKLPDKGSVDWYADMQNNYTILDNSVGTIAEHTTALSGKAPLVHTHTKADITDFPVYGTTAGTICEGNDSRLSDARTPVAHTHGKADITDLFNSANTWTNSNTYSKAITIEKSSDTDFFFNAKHTAAELGSLPSSDQSITWAFKDKNDDNLCYARVYYETTGGNSFRIFVRNKYTSGSPSTSGTADYTYFGLKINADKSKEGVLRGTFRPYDNNTYDLGSLTYRWNAVYSCGSNVRSSKIDFTDTTTTGTKAHWHLSNAEKNGSTFFQIGSQRNHSAGLNEEHFRIKNVNDKWADLYIQLDDSNQFSIGTTTHSDVTNNGFRGKFTPLGSFIPYANNSYDLGSSSYQWNNLYAKNYYCDGVAWGLDKENVWSANQKIANNPSYLYCKNTSMTMGTTPTSNLYSGVVFQDSNNSELGKIAYKKHKNSNNVLILNVKNTDGTNNYECSATLSLTPSGSASFYPEGDDCNLGQATTPWKTFNGINPGALSLPDLTSNGYINLSDNISANTEYSYTPSADGWLALYVLTAGFHVENAVGIFNGSSSGNAHRLACSATSGINLARLNYYHGAVILPVIAGITYLCWIKIDSSTTLASKVLYFYKAAGNV